MAEADSRYVLEVIRQDVIDPLLVGEMACRQGRAQRMAEMCCQRRSFEPANDIKLSHPGCFPTAL